jgi:hypothetical protein
MIPEVGVPNAGVMRVGEVEPTTLPVPVCPDKVVFSALLVAITYPYTTVILPRGAAITIKLVLATTHIIVN